MMERHDAAFHEAQARSALAVAGDPGNPAGAALLGVAGVHALLAISATLDSLVAVLEDRVLPALEKGAGR